MISVQPSFENEHNLLPTWVNNNNNNNNLTVFPIRTNHNDKNEIVKRVMGSLMTVKGNKSRK